MARYYNIIIPTSLSDVFETLITFDKRNKYERFAYTSKDFTRYRIKHADLLRVLQQVNFNYQIGCPEESRCELLYCIARDILYPVSICKPK